MLLHVILLKYSPRVFVFVGSFVAVNSPSRRALNNKISRHSVRSFCVVSKIMPQSQTVSKYWSSRVVGGTDLTSDKKSKFVIHVSNPNSTKHFFCAGSSNCRLSTCSLLCNGHHKSELIFSFKFHSFSL